MKIYPDHKGGIIYIETSKSIPAKTKIEVINLYGKILIQKDWIEGSRQELNLYNLPRGLYFIRIKSKVKYQKQKVVLQ